jgi:hypothetical protein
MGSGPKYKYSYEILKTHARMVCDASDKLFLIQPPYYTTLKVFATAEYFVFPHPAYELFVTQLCQKINRRLPRPPTHQRLKDLLRNFSPQNTLRNYYEGLLTNILSNAHNGYLLLEDLDYSDEDFSMIWEDLCAYEFRLPRTLAASPQVTPPPSPSAEFRDYLFVEHTD